MKTLLALILSLILVLFPSTAHAQSAERNIAVVGQPRGFSIHTAMAEWNRSPRVNFFSAASCVGQQHCVKIVVAPLQGRTVGYAWLRWNSLGQTTATITLDPRPQTHRERWQTMCHELGHVLYLGHTETGCMKSVVTGRYVLPGSSNLMRAR